LKYWAYKDSDGTFNYWFVNQATRKYTLTGIEWDRVAKMRVSYLLRTPAIDYDIPFKWYYGLSSATEPSGSNEPWDGTGWTLFASHTATSSVVYTYGVLDIVGCQGTFWLAGFADVTSPPFIPGTDEDISVDSTCTHVFGGTYGGETYDPVFWEITYNLATP